MRVLLMLCGSLALALGIVGVFLPLLPSTPLLILAAFCYARSSEKLYRRLMDSSFPGRYIRLYSQGRGIPLKQKLFTIILLWLTIGTTGIFFVNSLWVRILLLAVASGVTFHLVSLPTFKPPAG